ncbi:hypothetical protein LAZ67_5000623, partial [Cordylochernes scorpioides]
MAAILEQRYCIKNPDFMNSIITVVTLEAFHATKTREDLQVHSNIKVMLTAFFNSHSVVHHEYTQQGQTKSTTRIHIVTEPKFPLERSVFLLQVHLMTTIAAPVFDKHNSS